MGGVQLEIGYGYMQLRSFLVRKRGPKNQGTNAQE